MSMKSRTHWIAATILGSLGMVGIPAWAARPATAPVAEAELMNAHGAEIGTAKFYPASGGVRLVVDVHGLTAGEKGIHIHEKGSCVPPDFNSAGGHLNPDKKHHGLMNPAGHHEGDMPNLRVSAAGNARQEFKLKGVELIGTGPHSLFKSGGTALVIHADADDEKSDPAGNAGPKIACGVIKKL